MAEGQPPRVALISFTARGAGVNRRLARALAGQGYVCGSYEKRRGGEETALCEPEIVKVEESAARWAGQRFSDTDCLIFIGAAGIAVRSVAPWLRDKWTDPAVVVIDEAGKYVIPILSGHVGGANEMAKRAAGILGAAAVITTATDLNRRFAVDLFAMNNGLMVTDRVLAKEISGEILAGGRVGVFSDYPIEGRQPEELTWGQAQERNFWITRQAGRERPREMEAEPMGAGGECGGECVLKLVPRTVHIGVGCRKGTPGQQIWQAVMKVLEQWDCAPEAVSRIASIDLKKEEPGLLYLSRRLGVPFCTYSREALAGVEGDFQESDFVASVAGVGNVCERAALRSVSDTENGGRIICKKQVVDKVTVALAEEWWKGCWDR